MKKINLSYIINLLSNALLIAFLPSIIIISFLYSSNFNLLNYNYTIINGNSFYYDDEIISSFNLKKSLIEIDPMVIQNKLDSMDYIQSSKVSKIYPNTILIEIIENQPLAYFQIDKNSILIDVKEQILPVNNKVKAFFKIPTIILEVENIQSDNLNSINLNNYNEIIAILKFSKDHFNSLYNGLDKIYLSNDSITLFYMKNTKIFLSKYLGENDIKNLSKFKKTIQNYKFLDDYSYIDMRTPNQIIVKEKE